MAIYFFIYAVLFMLGLADLVVKKNWVYTYVYILFGLFILFFAGFRTCSIDYQGYLEIFNNLKNTPLKNMLDPDVIVEPAYAFLNITLGNFNAVIFVMALLNILILFPFIKKYSPYPFMSLLFYAGLFLYAGLMGLIRQSMAISICLWAMVSLKNKRFFSLVALAMMFHVSAVIVVFARLIKNSFYRFRTYLITMGIAIAANLLFYGTFKLLVNYLPTFVEWKLEFYLAAGEGTRFGFNEAVMIRLFTFALAFAYRDRIREAFPKGPLLVNIYFLALVMYTGLGFLPQLAFRGAVYFHYMELLVVPMIISVADKRLRIPIFLLYAGFSLWRHIAMVTNEDAIYYVPYTNLLFN